MNDGQRLPSPQVEGSPSSGSDRAGGGTANEACTTMAVRLDPGTRMVESPGGLVLVGGTPLRVFRLPSSAIRRLGFPRPPTYEPWSAAPATKAERSALGTLLDAGVLHPVASPDPAAPAQTTVVIPVRNRAGKIGALVRSLDGVADVLVVDDASTDGSARQAEEAGARVLRLPVRRGPAGARNRGLAVVATPLVAFLDSDVRIQPGWVEELAGHLADPTVAVVAPRVRGDVGRRDWLARYEWDFSPQDMGPRPASVRPDGGVTFLPAAALLARTAAIVAIGGFREDMEVGEDVDLVWRVLDAGWRVRYEPSTVVFHEARSALLPLLRRRLDYGTSAAPLDRRHPGQVAPISLSPWTAALWAALVVGKWRPASAIAVWTLVRLHSTLRQEVARPWALAGRIAGAGHLLAARTIGDAVSRTWLPAVAIAAMRSSSARRVLVLAWVVGPALRWWERRPDLDPARAALLNVVDDAAYCLGVWQGCLRERSIGALIPRRTGRSRTGPVVTR